VEPELIWLHVGSDALIAMAYFSIPIALAILYRSAVTSIRMGLLGIWRSFIFRPAVHACPVDLYAMGADIWHRRLVKARYCDGVCLHRRNAWPLLPELLTITSPFELRRVRAALEEDEMKGRGAERDAPRNSRNAAAPCRESMGALDGCG